MQGFHRAHVLVRCRAQPQICIEIVLEPGSAFYQVMIHGGEREIDFLEERDALRSLRRVAVCNLRQDRPASERLTLAARRSEQIPRLVDEVLAALAETQPASVVPEQAAEALTTGGQDELAEGRAGGEPGQEEGEQGCEPPSAEDDGEDQHAGADPAHAHGEELGASAEIEGSLDESTLAAARHRVLVGVSLVDVREAARNQVTGRATRAR